MRKVGTWCLAAMLSGAAATSTLALDKSGLIAAYPMDEGAGATAADISGNGHDGVITDGAWVSGVYGEAVEFTFEAPENVARYLVDKGSICVDGISLTVNETDGAQFSVVLIPHTQSIVHLHLKRAGDRVNLEADLVGKYIERLMPPRGDDRSPIDLETLARAGFVT